MYYIDVALLYSLTNVIFFIAQNQSIML